MSLKKKKVLLVGNCVLDFITLNEEYPLEDSDKRCISGYWQRGGNSSNASTVLSLLGASVEFFGVLSQSEAFRILIEDCHKYDISIEHCPKAEQDPPFSSVILSKKTGSRTIIHCNANFPKTTFEQFKRIDLNKYGWVHFEARNTVEAIKMMKHVREHNVGRTEKISISLDLEGNYDNAISMCEFAEYIVLSKDLANSFGWNTVKESCYGLREKVSPKKDLNVIIPNIICPWGAQGAGVLDCYGVFKLMPAFPPEEIVDSLGAGDCFMGAFIYAVYWRGRCTNDGVEFGNRVAGHKIGTRGYNAVAQLSTLI